MDGFGDFISWLFHSVPWWVGIIAIPILKIWWDSGATKRYERDREQRGMEAPKAGAAARKRSDVANLITIFATILLTLLAAGAAYQVDQDVKDRLTKVETLLAPATGEGLDSKVASMAQNFQSHTEEYSSFKQSAATRSEVERLRQCTKQWFESLESKERKVDKDCFPNATRGLQQ